MQRDFISTLELSDSEWTEILSLARDGKECSWAKQSRSLCGKRIALVFLNPSLRTRASFQVGIGMLGGQSVVLEPGKESWALEFGDGVKMDGGAPEHIKEFCGVLSRYFDLVCVRAFAKLESWQEDSHDFAMAAFRKYLSVPLISMESALWHPCQGLADALTLKETFGESLREKTFVLSWAPHVKALPMAVPNSALLTAARLGMQVRLACPRGFELHQDILGKVEEVCKTQGRSLQISNAQSPALDGADVVYAKSWAPASFLGRDFDQASFSNWQLGSEALHKHPNLRYMHCLPVRRNVELSGEVLDSKHSLHLDQAENRLHAQNALMLKIFGQ